MLLSARLTNSLGRVTPLNVGCTLTCLSKNTPFPSSKKSHFQNEAKCETFVVKMRFICIIIKHHFRINGFALSLALKVRVFGTRKRPIGGLRADSPVRLRDIFRRQSRQREPAKQL